MELPFDPAVATETLYELLHDRHRIRRWRIGREPGLRALTRDAMLRFYRNFYRPGNTVLVIAGDVDPDEAMREVVARYGPLPAGAADRADGPEETAAPGFRYREWSGDIGQTQVAFGWRTPPTLDDATPALDILATVLAGGRASRLYRLRLHPHRAWRVRRARRDTARARHGCGARDVGAAADAA